MDICNSASEWFSKVVVVNASMSIYIWNINNKQNSCVIVHPDCAYRFIYRDLRNKTAALVVMAALVVVAAIVIVAALVVVAALVIVAVLVVVAALVVMPQWAEPRAIR